MSKNKKIRDLAIQNGPLTNLNMPNAKVNEVIIKNTNLEEIVLLNLESDGNADIRENEKLKCIVYSLPNNFTIEKDNNVKSIGIYQNINGKIIYLGNSTVEIVPEEEYCIGLVNVNGQDIELDSLVNNKYTFNEAGTIYVHFWEKPIITWEVWKDNLTQEMKCIYDKFGVEYYEVTKQIYEAKVNQYQEFDREIMRYEQNPEDYSERLKLIGIAHAYGLHCVWRSLLLLELSSQACSAP